MSSLSDPLSLSSSPHPSALHLLRKLSESVCDEQRGVHKSIGAVPEAGLVSGGQGTAHGVDTDVPADVVELVNLQKTTV